MERLLWNGPTEKVIHVKICILQLLVVPHSEQLPGLRVDLQGNCIFGGFLWNRNKTEKEAPDRSFKNRMLQRCLLEVTGCPYIVQFLEFFGSESSRGCQQRAVQRDEAGEWKKAGYCSGCGVGCENALGMQRPHVRQRERALCENTQAECQSCGEPLSRFFILVLVVAPPRLGSVRIGVNFLECAGVWSELSRCRGTDLPWSGKELREHPTFPVCSALCHPDMAFSILYEQVTHKAPCFALVFPKISFLYRSPEKCAWFGTFIAGEGKHWARERKSYTLMQTWKPCLIWQWCTLCLGAVMSEHCYEIPQNPERNRGSTPEKGASVIKIISVFNQINAWNRSLLGWE